MTDQPKKRPTGEHVAIDDVPTTAKRGIDKLQGRSDGAGHRLSETLASEGVDFDYVRVVGDDGKLSPEVWKKVNTRRGKNKHDVMAELCAPRLPGCAPEARRWSVTWNRLVFCDEGGMPLVIDEEGRVLVGVKP